MGEEDFICDIVPMKAQDLDDLRHALDWALGYISHNPPESGEDRESYTGAQRIAWPDNPENWDGE